MSNYGKNINKKKYIKIVDSNEYENYTKHVVKWTEEVIQTKKEVKYPYTNLRCYGKDEKRIKNCIAGSMETGNEIITIDRLIGTLKFDCLIMEENLTQQIVK